MMAEQADLSRLVVGVLGGTGDQGRGLARRLAMAGQRVIIGSRDADRAIAAMPWEGHRDLLASLAAPLAGKVLIDCVNPMGFDGKGAFALAVPEGSAAQQAAAVLPLSSAPSTTCRQFCCSIPRCSGSTRTFLCSGTTGRPPNW
jgi:predicted dinucleotide-binding enzyme